MKRIYKLEIQLSVLLEDSLTRLLPSIRMNHNWNRESSEKILFQGDPRYALGNILHDDFSKFRNSSRMHELSKLNQLELSQMQLCPEFAVCNGWCPHERYLSARHNPYHTISCCGLIDLISHIRENLPTWI
jgi:radical SAM protein with 4Fe4S-binding SPASM domain